MNELISTGVWRRLSSAARASARAADVAVAYLGKGAARLMPLPRGSRLLVDASDGAVKSGQTCPDELEKLRSRGVRVFSAENLHAKVFVFGSTAFVGSANASRHSADVLEEAVVASTDPGVVGAARDFVRSRCLDELGPEELKRLSRLYKPPRITGGRAVRRAKRGARLRLRRMRIAGLEAGDMPEGSETVRERGAKAARKQMQRPRSHELEDFFWHGRCRFQPGEAVIQVVDEGRGRCYVSPPGTVIDTARWSGGRGKCTFVYVEVPRRRRVELGRLARRIGRGAKKRLLQSGAVNAEWAQRLRAAWAD